MMRILMRSMASRCSLALLFLGGLLLVAGCAGGSASAKGKLTFKDKPLKGSEEAPIQVSFCPIVNDEDRFEGLKIATVDQDNGTYEVTGLSPGKYRIAVVHESGPGEDAFEGRFGEGESPIIREVKGNDEINLELFQPEGT